MNRDHVASVGGKTGGGGARKCGQLGALAFLVALSACAVRWAQAPAESPPPAATLVASPQGPASTASDINVVAIPSHMSGESPRLLFVHCWGRGHAEDLASAVKRTLDLTAWDGESSAS